MNDSNNNYGTFWSIRNNSHSKSNGGYWGPVQANHAFCEPHYAVSPYIAEFFNSTSSIIYILLATLVKFPKDSIINTTARWWLGAVGVGSILFHGTMRSIFQLTDEIPMVGFLATLLIAKISTPHPWLLLVSAKGNTMTTTTTTRRRTVQVANAVVVFFSVTLMGIYIVLDEYEIFIHGFSLFVLVDTLVTLSLLFTSGENKYYRVMEKRAYVVSLVSIVLGRIAWESEHLLCAHHPQVWPLHVVWHLLSCTSAYAAMVTVYVIRRGGAGANTMPRFWGFRDLIDEANKEEEIKAD